MIKKPRRTLKLKEYKLLDNSQRTKILTCIFIILCLLFIIAAFFINDCWRSGKYLYKNMLINIMNMLASIFGLSAAWEVVCKRSFSKEILNLGGVTDSYIDSGIKQIYKSFKDINWSNELKNVKNFTVFFSYGYTWRNHNKQLLEKLGRDIKFTVILPDYNDKNVVAELNRRFEYDVELEKNNVSVRIEDAAKEFKKMGANVKLYNGTICATYYFFDDTCIYAPFKHNKEKVAIPAIKCQKEGNFYDFCKMDLRAIIEKSEDWEDPSSD